MNKVNKSTRMVPRRPFLTVYFHTTREFPTVSLMQAGEEYIGRGPRFVAVVYLASLSPLPLHGAPFTRREERLRERRVENMLAVFLRKRGPLSIYSLYTDKKENLIQIEAVAKSYITNGIGKYLRVSSYIRKPFLIYDFATDSI